MPKQGHYFIWQLLAVTSHCLPYYIFIAQSFDYPLHSGTEAGSDNQQVSNEMAARAVLTYFLHIKETDWYTNILTSLGQQLPGAVFKFVYHYVRNVKQISV